MNRLRLILLALAFLPSFQLALAQKAPFKLGDISMEEMTMTRYDKDTSASAVILMNYGDAYIDIETGKMVFERYSKIKILKKDGLDHADVAIYLNKQGSDKENVSGLKASTYNLENGQITSTKLSKDGTFTERINKNAEYQKFTFPNVKEGSVLEYYYKKYSDWWAYFPNWEFQEEIPVVYSEFRARIPQFLVYERYMQGYLTLSDYTTKEVAQANYSTTTHRWVIKDVPAFKSEPHMTCEDDYVSRINFALSYISYPGQPVREIMGSWSKLNKSYLEWEYFGKLINGSGFLKKDVELITAGLSDPMEKTAKIFDYIRSNVEWNKEYDNSADVTSLKKIFDEHKGNCAEINLALASMLDKAGISVEMVLISTRDHGFIREQYPMQRQFNYAICQAKVGDKVMLLDATDRLLPMDQLPERCLNGKGLVISETNSHWIEIPTKMKSKVTVQALLAIGEGGELEGKVDYSRNGYYARSVRNQFTSKGEKEYLKEEYGDRQWVLGKSEFKNMEVKDFSTLNETAIESHEVTISGHVNEAGNVIYIEPFVDFREEYNPFVSEMREYPVDFGSPFDEVYILNLTVPDGCVVDEMPPQKVIGLPGGAGRYIYSAVHNGNVITITSMLTISKPLFTQMEYPVLREFYSQVVEKQAEQIVLKRQ